MTLKQFGEVAGGVVICFILYQTNLPAIIKWPLIAILFGGGLAAAFVPIEERPLSHWIATFFSILYKPTQFFWKRAYNIPAPFLFKGNSDNMLQMQELDLTPARRQRIKEFISSTGTTETVGEFTNEEQSRMSDILNIFQTQTTIGVREEHTEVIHKPNLTVRVRSMRQFEIPSEEVEKEHFTVNSLDSVENLDSTIVLQTDEPTSSSYKKNSYLESQQVAQGLEIPEIQPVDLGIKNTPEEVSALIQQQNINPTERAYLEDTQPHFKIESASESVHFNNQLPFPSQPTVANKLVGMVLTPNNDLVPGAIVEIKTANGHVSRAVKTNALGQFFITTPLNNGDYVVSVEKEGQTFRPVSIQLVGKIVEPLEIRSS
jgi:hypothetical protein